MRVRLIADQLGPNPKFDRRRPVSAANPINVTVPAGTVIDDPEAIYLVINDQAEPIDDEAKQAYARHIERKEQALLARRHGRRPTIPFPAPAPQEQPQPQEAKPEPVATPAVQDKPSQPPAGDVKGAEEASAPVVTPAADSDTPGSSPAARPTAHVAPAAATPTPLRGLDDLRDAA